MLGAMDLGITDDGERADHEQAAQIAVTCTMCFVISYSTILSGKKMKLSVRRGFVREFGEGADTE
jgi:hypothetical protein